jgi:hypothetical protein
VKQVVRPQAAPWHSKTLSRPSWISMIWPALPDASTGPSLASLVAGLGPATAVGELSGRVLWPHG